MALVSYRSSSDLLTPLFEDLLRSAGPRVGNLLRAPEADVVENDREIRITVELAGMQPDEISIDVENNVLTISGEKREERKEDKDRYHLTARRYGRFSRSFVLPAEVESDRVQARFENGVLTITIPKSEKSRHRHISVEGSSGQLRSGQANSGGSEQQNQSSSGQPS